MIEPRRRRHARARVDSRVGTPCVDSVRDDGAGVCVKGGALMAHGDRLRDLVEELEEVVHKCNTPEMERIIDVVNETLHKATSLSRISISLGCVQQVCKVPEYYASVAGMRNRTPASGGGGGSQAAKPKSPKKRSSGGGNGGASSGPSSSGGGGSSNTPGSPPKGARTEKWPDVAGALGPNKLERKVGGNPAGEPCSRFANGSCPFKTCSYKH